MGMDISTVNTGKKGYARPEMNVTPLVDVVLVLLIIFMVLTAVMKEQFSVHVPGKELKAEQKITLVAADDQAPIVVNINLRGQIQINQDVYPDRDFPERLRRMLIARGDRRVYFDASDGVPYARAMQVLDLAREGGAAHVAVVTEKLQD